MNILFYGSRFSPHVVRPLMEMMRRGHRVLLLDRSSIAAEGMPPCPFEWRALPLNKPDERMDIPRFIRDIATDFKPDVLHIHWADSQVIYCLSANVAPVVVSVWGSDMNRPVAVNENGFPVRAISKTSRFFYYTSLLNFLPRSAAVVVDDTVMVTKCRFLAGEDVPVYNIHLGADEEYFIPIAPERIQLARDKFGLAENEKLILSPRAFAPRYGHLSILEAFAALNAPETILAFKLYNGQDLPSGDTHSIVSNATSIGTNMPADIQDFERAIRVRAEQLGVSDKIRFINLLDRSVLPLCLAMVDLLVNNPVMDGFPVTFIEAAAMGKPVVTPLLPAYSGTFAEKYFFLAKDGSPLAMADAMRKALSTPLDKSKMRTLYNETWGNYSLQNYTTRVLQLYQDVAKQSPIRQKNVHSWPPLLLKQHIHPLLSFLIPSHNYGRFLGECLESLINQTDKNWEAIVVDDGSTDMEFHEIISHFNDDRISFFRFEKNQGKGRALNLAYRKSRGQYIVVLDADDKLAPAYVGAVAKIIRGKTKPSFIYPKFRLFGNRTAVWPFTPKSEEDMILEQWIPGPGAAIRNNIYAECGGFYEGPELQTGNIDWDFLLSAYHRQVRVAYIPRELYFYRIHGNSISDKRRRFEYISRECMYRRHAGLFDKFFSGAQFRAIGYTTAAAASWERGEWLRAALLAAQAFRLFPLPLQISFEAELAKNESAQALFWEVKEDKDALSAVLHDRLESDPVKGLAVSMAQLRDRCLLATLLIKRDMNEAKRQMELAVAAALALKNWVECIKLTLILAFMVYQSADRKELGMILDFARIIARIVPGLQGYEAEIVFFRVDEALSNNDFQLARRLAQQCLDVKEVSHNAFRLYGLVVCHALGEGNALADFLTPCAIDADGVTADMEKGVPVAQAELMPSLYASEFGRKMYWTSRSKELCDRIL